MPNVVRMLAFAGARDALGASEVDFPLEAPCTARELLESACERFPALRPYKGALRVAVNGVYAVPEDRIAFGDEVALIPPVSGG